MQNIKLPELGNDAVKWAQICGLMGITAKDIVNTFGVCRATANKVINRIYDYELRNDRKIYNPHNKKIIPTTTFLEVYGYDEKEILRRARKSRPA